jgi:hypothetical protein
MIWLILIFFFVILLLALDWRHFKLLMGKDWNWWTEGKPFPDWNDFEIRAGSRHAALRLIPNVSATDLVDTPDAEMEDLIHDGDILRARMRLSEHLHMARETRNTDMLRTYSIYSARISWKEAELRREFKEQTLHERREAFRSLRGTRATVSGESMEASTFPEFVSDTLDDVRLRFLEFRSKGIPRTGKIIPDKTPVSEFVFPDNYSSGSSSPIEKPEPPPLWKKKPVEPAPAIGPGELKMEKEASENKNEDVMTDEIKREEPALEKAAEDKKPEKRKIDPDEYTDLIKI